MESLGGKGKLTTDLVTKLTRYYGWALKTRKGDVQGMKRAVMAAYHHTTSNDLVSDHSFCPPGPSSWCRQNAASAKGEAAPKHRYNLPPYVCKALLPIYERLSNERLLQRCQRGSTQNSNESFHSQIWALAPKEQHASLFTVHSINTLHIVAANKPDINDRLWKVRPLLKNFQARCHDLEVEEHLYIDEQIVPFKGHLNIKEYVKGKPHPRGMKISCYAASPAYDL